MAAARTKAEEAEATAQAAHLEGSAVLRLGVGLERGEHGGVEGLELDLSIPASLVAVRTGRLVALTHLAQGVWVRGARCAVEDMAVEVEVEVEVQGRAGGHVWVRGVRVQGVLQSLTMSSSSTSVHS